MTEPDKTVLEVAQEIGESSMWIKAGFGSSDLAAGYKSLLASEETPEEAIQSAKNDIVESLDKGEISRELANVMTAIINKSGTDSEAFAGNVISNIDQITAGLAAPAAAPKVADIPVKKDEPVLGNEEVEVAANDPEPEEVEVKPATVENPATILPTNEEEVTSTETELGADVTLNEPADPAQQNNFLALLANGDFDIKDMMGKLDFAGNPMQAIMGLITMFSAMSEGKDPMKALEAFQNKQNNPGEKPEDKPTDEKPEEKPTDETLDENSEEDKNYETGPDGKPLTAIVTGQDIGENTSANVDLTGDNGVTINGQSVLNRFADNADPDPDKVTFVDSNIDPNATTIQPYEVKDAVIKIAGLGD